MEHTCSAHVGLETDVVYELSPESHHVMQVLDH